MLHLLLLSVLCLVGMPFVARADDFCAATVEVVSWDGKPNIMTWIELDDSSGKPVRREMVHGSVFRLCDFGFGPHTLSVGTNECLPVAISNLRVVIGSPLHLRVVLNGCGYRNMRSGCLAYFRVVDGDGRHIPHVDFSPALTNGPQRTDSYGRWQDLFRGNHDLTFVKAGFEPATIHLQCLEDEEVDQQVVMQKARQPK